MKYENIKEATRAWQSSFNAFPLGMIEKLFYMNVDDWSELTPISEGCTVLSNEYQNCAEVIDITEDEEENKIAKIRLYETGEEVETNYDDLSREEDSYFPMWGWMWQFDDSIDDWWLENHLEEMAECGFRIYESQEFGYFFGIDGCGYDFYEAHWIPLYKARGLHWHKEVMGND